MGSGRGGAITKANIAKIGGFAAGGGTLTIVNAEIGRIGGTGRTATITVSPTATAGNLLVVCIASDGVGSHTGHTVTSTPSATWIKAVGYSGSGTASVSIWYLPNCGAVTQIVAGGASDGTYVSGVMHEVSGASTSTPWTNTEYNGNVYTSNQTNPQTGSVTNGTAASIFFAVMEQNINTNPSAMVLNQTGTSGGTWAHYSANSYNVDGSSYMQISAPYLIVSASAATAHGWTGESSLGCAAIAAFH